MSQETLEAIVRLGIDAVNSKDVDSVRAATDPDGELISRFAAIDGKIYRGHAGISDYLADLDTAWEDFRIEIEMFIPAREEKLAVVARMTGTAREAGFPGARPPHPSLLLFLKGSSRPGTAGSATQQNCGSAPSRRYRTGGRRPSRCSRAAPRA